MTHIKNTPNQKPPTTANQQSNGYKTFANNWIDKQEVLAYMRISERTLQKWRSEGTIPHYPIGARIYYKEGDLEEMMEKHKSIGVKKRKQR